MGQGGVGMLSVFTALLIRACFGVCQVIGPHAAGYWLAEICRTQRLQYDFVHCTLGNDKKHPAIEWLMQTAGWHPNIARLPHFTLGTKNQHDMFY